jgi:methylphosphotriester-DNA--protein-cysteine methyltransferase
MSKKMILTTVTLCIVMALLSSGLTFAYKYRSASLVGKRVTRIIENQTAAYIGNAETGVFHIPRCPQVRSIPKSQKVHLYDRLSAEEQDMQPCPDCNP